MIDRNDLGISRRIRDGDPSAEEEFILRFQPRLTAIARIRAGVQSAPDLVQQALISALVNLRHGDWRAEGSLAAYVATILRRLILRTRLQARAWPPPAGQEAAADSTGTDPVTLMEKDRTSAQVHSALARLPARQREVLIRHYMEGQAVSEIARAMRIPRGTVLSRLHYARARLAKVLDRVHPPAHVREGKSTSGD